MPLFTATTLKLVSYRRLCGRKRDSASRGESSGFDPHVWSGRALQEGFVDLADVRSCINVSGF